MAPPLKTQMTKWHRKSFTKMLKVQVSKILIKGVPESRLEEALKEHDSTPLGMFDRLLLPDGISVYELDQRLEKWVHFHNPVLMGSTIHALGLPVDLNRARTHVLHMKLLPRVDHGGSAGRYFRVAGTEVIEVAQAEKWAEPWPASLKALKEMQDESERMGRGRITAAMVECPPLAVQTVPFGSIKSLADVGPLPNWENVMNQYVEAGKRFTGSRPA